MWQSTSSFVLPNLVKNVTIHTRLWATFARSYHLSSLESSWSYQCLSFLTLQRLLTSFTLNLFYHCYVPFFFFFKLLSGSMMLSVLVFTQLLSQIRAWACDFPQFILFRFVLWLSTAIRGLCKFFGKRFSSHHIPACLLQSYLLYYLLRNPQSDLLPIWHFPKLLYKALSLYLCSRSSF